MSDEREETDDLPEQMRVRREKRQQLVERGEDPYPVTVPRTHTLMQVVEAVVGYAVTPALREWYTEGDLEEWQVEMEYNWSLTGGAPLEAFEQWNQDMIANENVPEDFDWKEHADFSCLTEAQEALGLEAEPGNL